MSVFLLAITSLFFISSVFAICDQAAEDSLGCDIVLNVATFGAGHPDYFQLTGSSYVGKILCIPAGSYSALALIYVEGAAGSPVTIINCGGKVVLDGRDSGAQGNGWWTPISAKGSRYIHITGTGDSSVEYGFELLGSSSHGAHFDEGCSDIEVDGIETHSNNYAGITVRTYPRCGGRCGHVEGNPSYDKLCSRGNFVQENTVLHNNYIHDVPGEGIYVGTSHYHMDETANVYDPGNDCPGETQAQPELKGVDIYNNLVEDTGMDGIQVGAAVENVKVHHNIIRRWAYVQKYGDANAIGMNPGSVGDVYNNWMEGKIRSASDSEEYFGVVFYGHGSPNQLSRIYNNVILHVNNGFMFLNREEVAGQQYEFAHNTVHDFTGSSPVKLYCLATVEPFDHPISSMTIRNNIFSLGLNAEIYDQPGGHKKFYGNTNGITGMECMDYNDTYNSNLYKLDDSSLVNFQDSLNLDFHLQESSPAVGTAVALANGPVSSDYDGNSRGDPSDQGAFQFTAAPTNSPTKSPNNSPTTTVNSSESIEVDWYPDWQGRTNTCKNDGNEPTYMKIFQFFYESSLDACCKKYFSWDVYTCTGNLGTTPDGYYPNWGKTETKCLNSTETADNLPDYMMNNPEQWLDSDIETCCERHYSWAYNECISLSGGSTPSMATGDWYVNHEKEICQQDCPEENGASCGGLANTWDTLYSTPSDCCAEMLYWIASSLCEARSTGMTFEGTTQWYVNWSIGKCVKDCEDSSDATCGGYAQNWDELFSTANSCCERLWYIERDECTNE